jgi:hypothetical protein
MRNDPHADFPLFCCGRRRGQPRHRLLHPEVEFSFRDPVPADFGQRVQECRAIEDPKLFPS